MKNKLIMYIVTAYFVLLTIVLISQLPQKEVIATEPVAADLKYEDKLKNAVVLYVNSPVALMNQKQILIDSDDGTVMPVYEDNEIYVPVRFLSKAFNANISWGKQNKETIIRYNNKAIVLGSGKTKMKIVDNESEDIIPIDSSPKVINGRTYIPLKIVAEVFEKELLYYNNLIVISNIENIFNINTEKKLLDELIEKVNNLPVIGSEEKLKELIGEQNDSGIFKFFANTAPAPMESDTNVNDTATKEEYDSDFSSTNVQVGGVDEADIIKNDGEYIYFAGKEKITIVDAFPAEDMHITSSIEFSRNFQPIELYIENEKLIVIGNESDKENYNNEMSSDSDYDYDVSYNSKCVVFIYDIEDKQNVELIREVNFDGHYNTSRKIDSYLYVVSNISVYELFKDTKYMYMPPSYLDTFKSSNNYYMDYNDIYYFPDMKENTFTIIAGLKLDEPEQFVNMYAYLGSSENLYVSNENMYITVQNTIPYINNKNDSITNIYKFSLKEGKIFFNGRTNALGHIQNQFSMDEYNGYFRIATTIYNFELNKESNNIFIFDENLKQVGKIENIALGERIYSTRFTGDTAYMVTFKNTDPLFVIDLKNPQKPEILGALKIPGFSEYLHPYDKNHVIGFGKDTVVYEDNAYYKGFKMSMFDVSDFTNPIEMFTEVIGDRGTESELLYNHKSLLFSKDKNLIAFPLTLAVIKDKENKDETQFGEFGYQGAYIYNVDMEKGFELEGRITHIDEESYLKSGLYSSDENKYVRRIIYIGDNLYTISNKSIMANKINDLSIIKKVDIS